MIKFYPLFVDLSGKRCLVVGGGKVAERKIRTLMNYDAQIQVVSPELTNYLREFAESRRMEWAAREYRRSDGDGAFLVIAATDQDHVNEQISEDARQRGQLINVVSRPDIGNFVVPSTVRRGKLQIAVSTSGASPLLARRIRRELEEAFGPEYEWYLDWLLNLRKKVQYEIIDSSRREFFFRKLAEQDVPGLIKQGQWTELERIVGQLREQIKKLEDEHAQNYCRIKGECVGTDPDELGD